MSIPKSPRLKPWVPSILLIFRVRSVPCLACRSSGVKWKCSAVISIVSCGTFVVSRSAGIGSNCFDAEQPKKNRGKDTATSKAVSGRSIEFSCSFRIPGETIAPILFAECEGFCTTDAFAFGEEPPLAELAESEGFCATGAFAFGEEPPLAELAESEGFCAAGPFAFGEEPPTR
jgi:hypothetical protein